MEMTIKKTDMFLIPLAAITADHSENGRFAPRGNMEELAESIRVYGQKQPVGVKRIKGDTFRLVYGFGRYEAMKLMNEGLPEDEQQPIKAVIVRENDKEMFLSNLIENVQRQDLSPIDYAGNIRRLIDRFGFNQAECADFFKRTPAWVSCTLTLCDLNYDIQDKVHKGLIGWADAVEMARNLDGQQQREVLAEMNKAEMAAEAKVEEVKAKPEAPAKKVEAAKKEAVNTVKKAAKAAITNATGKPAKKPYNTPPSKREGAEATAAVGKRSWGELHDFFEQMMNPNHYTKEVRTTVSIILKGMEGGIREDHEFAQMLATAIDRKVATAEAGGAA